MPIHGNRQPSNELDAFQSWHVPIISIFLPSSESIFISSATVAQHLAVRPILSRRTIQTNYCRIIEASRFYPNPGMLVADLDPVAYTACGLNDYHRTADHVFVY